MEIYLDANATTPVLPQARAAAMSVMAETFGNPSSVHGSGLRARARLDEARAAARRVLQAPSGRLLFTSGATEGIQTAVLSALFDLRIRRDAGAPIPPELLYGATEHKAVPEALRHWNAILGLNLDIVAIPVTANGRHDLAWLQSRAPRAGLICTMAANNETGVVSDLASISQIVKASGALWLVDGVQALGKVQLNLTEWGIDYAPFSGHKLYAAKGIGMLYVRDGAPFTPLMAGGGQEGASRSGTENMAGIAALGAVLQALETPGVFAAPEVLEARRERLAAALRGAFPGVRFNAAFNISLPTTLNFSVPGLSSKLLLDLFDAAGLRVSGGSACGASKAQPSYVLQAMGLPDWRTSAAVRMSFGAADSDTLVDEACNRIRACGEALRATCQSPASSYQPLPPELLTRFTVDAACCYVVADAETKQCVIVDPLPELTQPLAHWMRCRSFKLLAVLDTHSHGDHESSAAELRREAGIATAGADALGWPGQTDVLELGKYRLTRLAIPGHTADSTALLLHDKGGLRACFVGDTVMPGALGRSDFEQSAPAQFAASLKLLERTVGQDALLLPGHDYDERFATTLRVEMASQPLVEGLLLNRLPSDAFADQKALIEKDLGETEFQTVACGARVECTLASETVELSPEALNQALTRRPLPVVVDVREAYEERVSPLSELNAESVPLSTLINELARLAALPKDTPVIFVCRSGNRSARAAKALRRLGHADTWSLSGGLALWSSEPRMPTSLVLA